MLWQDGDRSGVPPQQAAKLVKMLTQLNGAKNPEAMRHHGYQLHRLEPRSEGFRAIAVTGNWRVTFRFDGTDATDVDLVDYH